MHLQQYILFLYSYLNTNRLSILFLSETDILTEYNNNDFLNNDYYLLCENDELKIQLSQKYKNIILLTNNQLINKKFELSITNDISLYINILSTINTRFFYCKNNTHLLSNYTCYDQFLFENTNTYIFDKIPLLIRSKDRLTNLYFTLNSLYTTNAKDLCKITIIDDKSESKEMIQFLTTNNKINFQINYNKEYKQFISNKNVAYVSNFVKNKNQIIGIKNKVNIFMSDINYGDRGGILFSIKYGFQNNPNAEFIIIMQNDIVFNQEWLNKLLELYNKIDKKTLGIISCWNNPNKKNVQPQKIDDYLVAQSGVFVGAQCYLISKNIYNILLKTKQFDKKFKPVITKEERKIATSTSDYNIAGDTYLLNIMYKNKFKLYLTVQSYIQHIGNSVSTCRNWRTLCIITDNFIGPVSYQQVF